jgi:hypothetical protein
VGSLKAWTQPVADVSLICWNWFGVAVDNSGSAEHVPTNQKPAEKPKNGRSQPSEW